MIHVTTVVFKQHGPEQISESTGSCRVQSCRIDFGAEREPLIVSSHFVYISPEYAHEDMKEHALKKIRSEGYAESEANIVWRLHMIGLGSMMSQTHIHKGWSIQLLPAQHDNGLWACPYVCERPGSADASLHRNLPPGLWDTKEEAEAASLAHAQAWIDSGH